MIKQFFAICLLLLSTSVVASSIGTMNGGLVAGGGADSTGYRERIELSRSGGLLVGRPKHSSIELITINAPEIADGHLILREIKPSAGRSSLLFSAPDSLVKNTRRITIYLPHDNEDFIFLEAYGGKWIKHELQPFSRTLKSKGSAVEGELLAVSVHGLGPFWLLENGSSTTFDPLAENSHQSARLLLGGDLKVALQPLAIAILFLVFGWGISLLVHRLDRHADR